MTIPRQSIRAAPMEAATQTTDFDGACEAPPTWASCADVSCALSKDVLDGPLLAALRDFWFTSPHPWRCYYRPSPQSAAHLFTTLAQDQALTAAPRWSARVAAADISIWELPRIVLEIATPAVPRNRGVRGVGSVGSIVIAIPVVPGPKSIVGIIVGPEGPIVGPIPIVIRGPPCRRGRRQ